MATREEREREHEAFVEQVRQSNAKTIQDAKDALQKNAETAQEDAEEYVSKTYPHLNPPD